MKKRIATQLLTTISIYAITYLCISFVRFDFINPFQWIINIPKYDNESRFLILFGILFYYAISFIIINNHYKEKNK